MGGIRLRAMRGADFCRLALRLAAVRLRGVATSGGAPRHDRAFNFRGALRRTAIGRLADSLFVLEDFFFTFISANPRPASTVGNDRGYETKGPKSEVQWETAP